mgnify:CR=1 FL=1
MAERAIQTIMGNARSMIFHKMIHWPGEVHIELWPLAIGYVIYIWNQMPNRIFHLSSLEILTESLMDPEKIRNMRVLRSSCFVDDPKLQDGKKLSRWVPWSRRV